MKKIFLDKTCEVFCVVDDEDYAWATQWRWGFTWDRTKTKRYATRSTRRRRETATQIKVYMHKEILKRSDILPPSEKHTIGDHEDGDSLNNRRGNLSWATVHMNNHPSRRIKRDTGRPSQSESERSAESVGF